MKTKATVHPAFPLMLARARALGWPEKFKRDLTFHDRRALAKRDPSEPLLWTIGPLGTHLVTPSGWGRNGHRFEDLRAVLETIRTNFAGYEWHWWDGRELWTVTPERAYEHCADEFERTRVHLRDLVAP